MHLTLRYFTGTGNSLRIAETCREEFVRAGYTTSIAEISKAETRIPEADLNGFCFPVYAFGIPRICRQYLKELQPFADRQKVFVLITAGGAGESGFAVEECEKILSRKNGEVICSAVIQMPNNWTVAPEPPFPPNQAEAAEIIRIGTAQAREISGEILAGRARRHTFSFPPRYTRFRFYRDYWSFRTLGVQNLWRMFRVYGSCNGCGLCERICPTRSIRMKEDRPVWASTCEQCMRCVNFCPQEAIYQSGGGDTKGKNRYYEPGFKPARN